MGDEGGAVPATDGPPEGSQAERLDDLKALVMAPRGATDPPAEPTWAGARRTSPELWMVSILVLGLGVALTLIVPFTLLFGTPPTALPGDFSGLGGAIELVSGLMLILVGRRLIRRERAVWAIAEFVLFFAVLATVLRNTIESLMLTGLALLVMARLAMLRDLFVNPRRYNITVQESVVFSALVLVVIYGVAGTLYISEDGGFDPPVEDTTDALYYTVHVITTVGDSGFHATSPLAKWFSVSLMLLGISTFLAAVGIVLVPYIERRVKGVLGVRPSN